MLKRKTFFNTNLAELHVHVGSSVSPEIMWSIAHEQGIRLPTKDYWQFVKMFTITSERIKWDKFHELFHWTELIQSSTEAIERCVHEIISGAYRKCNITLLEVSFNPMFRCRKGERDMDHIIMSAIHGMDKAMLEYPNVKAGLIFMLDRRLPPEKNQIIAEKALMYKDRGVIGIDLAGPEPKDRQFEFKKISSAFKLANEGGLGTVVHAGEHKGENDVVSALKYLNPDRIVHCTNAYKNKDLLKEIKKRKITIALCPTSNLKNGIVIDIKELRAVVRAFAKAGIKFCINTDAPDFLMTNLIKEFEFLMKNKILTKEEILKSNKIAFESSFLNKRR